MRYDGLGSTLALQRCLATEVFLSVQQRVTCAASGLALLLLFLGPVRRLVASRTGEHTSVYARAEKTLVGNGMLVTQLSR